MMILPFCTSSITQTKIMRNLLLVFFTVTFSLSVLAQQKVIIRFENPDTDVIKEFTKPEYDVAAFKPGEYLDIVIQESEYNKIVSQGYNAQIIKTTAEMAANLGNVDDINGYRTYTEALQELQQIAANNPTICKLMDIGDSRGKEYFENGYGNYGDYQHDVWALKISDNVEIEEDEPAVYYFGAHHAREPLSTETAFFVLNHIIDNYGTDPEITENVNTKEIWFVPIVNPDGHEVVLNQIDLNWRKNIRDNDGNGTLTGGGWLYPDGVDPNRNYGWQWGTSGTSSDPEDQTYCGPTPFSEPEIQSIRDLMAAEHFVAGISYHTYSELVLWPYGYSSNAQAPDIDALADLGTNMGEAIPGISGGHYTPQVAWELYPCSGVTDDYAYGQHGIFSYTIELGTEFIPPASEVYQITQDNLEAAMILLNRVNYSTLTGHITNASTGDPVIAEIFIDEIDNTGAPREPYRSNEDFGTYYRLLTNNTYTVTITAFGYITQTFENVAITDDGQTILDIQLQPSQIISVSGTITDADSGEPIEGASIEVLNTPVDPVVSNENGEYEIEEIFENTYTFKIYAEDYATLIQVVTIDPQNNIADFELTESFAISFESGYFDQGWEFSGNADWVIDNSEAWDGSYSAKSGTIGDESTSEIIYTIEDGVAGLISFYRKVSSEPGYDFLQFYIDNQMQDEWAGEQDWEEFIYTVSAGTHIYKWVYEKDQSVSNGDDCGWIDYITFPPLAGVNAQAGSNAEICANQTHQCEGSAAYYETLEWTTSGDGIFSDASILNPVYTPGTSDIQNGSATLTLTAFDDQGNEDSDDLILTLNPLPQQAAAILGSEQVCAGGTEIYTCTTIENADEYEWLITPENAGTIESTTANEVTLTWTDGYFNSATLQVRGMNDCGYGEYSEAFVVLVEDCTGISENSGLDFSLFPNPASSEVLISFKNSIEEDITIRIFNLLGKQILQENYTSTNNSLKINVSEINEGICFISINIDGNTRLKKLIINR